MPAGNAHVTQPYPTTALSTNQPSQDCEQPADSSAHIWPAMAAYESVSVPPIDTDSSLYTPGDPESLVPAKRKAESNDHAHRSPQSEHPQSDSTSTPARLTPPCASRKAALSPPQPNSINAIIREHCRHRLYVRPELWTLKQLKLLGCEFVLKELPPRGQKLPPTELDGNPPTVVEKKRDATYDYAARAASQLCRPCALETRNWAVIELLASCKFKYIV